jgi:hypothetical protein
MLMTGMQLHIDVLTLSHFAQLARVQSVLGLSDFDSLSYVARLSTVYWSS